MKFYNKLSFFLICFFVGNNIFAFKHLDEINLYAKSYIEYPDADNEDWSNPNYSSYHKSMMPSFYTKFLSFFKTSKKPIFNKNKFIIDLTQTAQVLKKNHDLSEKNSSKIITVSKGTKLIIFGQISGAFHSLVRCLNELVKQKIIDKNLKIIDTKTYILFNGNVIGTGAYNIETLDVVLQMIKVNRANVIYLSGKKEDKERWKTDTFSSEIVNKLQMDIRAKKNNIIPKLKNFFESLWDIIYFQIESSNQILRCSPYALDEMPIQDKEILKNLKTLIMSRYMTIEDSQYDGLSFLGVDNHISLWKVYSAPTRSYRYLYNFFYDAFTTVDLAENLENTSIGLCSQDLRKMDGFDCSKVFNILTGKPLSGQSEEAILTTTGVSQVVETTEKAITERKSPVISSSENTITFGCTLDLTKSNLVYGKPIKTGLSLRMQKQNNEGGVDGKLIKVIFLDDNYVPQLSRKNIEKLITEEKTNLIIAPLGSPTLAASLDLIKDKKILVMFPNSGSPIFRQPDLTHLINFRVSYNDEAVTLMKYALDTYAPKKIVFFYQDDEFGQGPLAKSLEVLKERNFAESGIVKIPYQRNEVKVDEAIKKIVAANPDIIMFFSVSSISADLIRMMGVNRLINTKMFAISTLGEEFFRKFVLQNGLKLVVASAVPNPATSELPIVKEFRQEAKKQGTDFNNVYMLEGYIDMSLAIEILKKVEGEITPEKMIKVAEQIKDLNYKGLNLNFDPKTRQLNNTLWLDIGEGEWIASKVGNEK